MFRVTMHYFDTDGNEVSLDEWGDALFMGLVNAAIEQYTQRATETVSQLVCPTHGKKAELIFNVTGIPDKPSIEIQATSCCTDFSEKVVEAAYQSWSSEEEGTPE